MLKRTVVLLAAVAVLSGVPATASASGVTPPAPTPAGVASPASPNPPTPPVGGSVLGPFSSQALCIAQAYVLGLQNLTSATWQCVFFNGVWWIVISPKGSNNLDISLLANANSLYASAELGYSPSDPRYGMLRARANSIGPWENFWLLHVDAGVTALAGDNGLAVSAELGYSGSNYGMLRARANGVGPWEKYRMVPEGGSYVALLAANGKYVSAELGYSGSNYGMLRARASSVGAWEVFAIRFNG